MRNIYRLWYKKKQTKERFKERKNESNEKLRKRKETKIIQLML